MDNLHCSPESDCNSLFSVIKLNAAYLVFFLIMQIPLAELFFHASFYTLSKKIKNK